MPRWWQILTILAVLGLTGCATPHPVLYPNTTLKEQGPEAGQTAIKSCEAEAKRYGAGNGHIKQTAKGTAEGGAIGGAAGAAGGAVYGHAGEGAAAGAAAGATGSLIHGLFSSNKPGPVYRRFVDQCLRDRGYQPIGWR